MSVLRSVLLMTMALLLAVLYYQVQKTGVMSEDGVLVAQDQLLSGQKKSKTKIGNHGDGNYSVGSKVGKPQQRMLGVASPIYAYREMVERPLFSQSRRPEARVDASVSSNEPLKPVNLDAFPWQLSGISIKGKNRAALIWHKSLRQSFTVNERDSEQGWTIRKILADSVVMQERDNATNKVELYLRGPVQLAK
ncbi:MAG: hypothetical protein OEZ68_04075 [Gammaproteobacteria bacterium]|nr:hypothetical protein [Gammaproteobacteria bacterium]MDH5799964.1 hypothetical protein [Gammaproteobacteria bacterium]